MFIKLKIVAICLLFSSAAWADHDEGEHRGWGHHREYDREDGDGYYYTQPQPRYYAPPPPPPPRYYGYSQPSPQGLVGGMVGSALGYQMGSGNPLAAGIGAAAGALVGNGMNR